MDHLVQTNSSYSEIFAAAKEKRLPATFWTKVPFLPSFWGKMILKVVSPEYQKSSKTFKVWYPKKSQYGTSVLPDLIASNEKLIRQWKDLENLDLDGTIIVSPAGPFVTYTLRSCLN